MNKIYINGKYYNPKDNKVYIHETGRSVFLIVNPRTYRIPYHLVMDKTYLNLNGKEYPVKHIEQKYGDIFVEI